MVLMGWPNADRSQGSAAITVVIWGGVSHGRCRGLDRPSLQCRVGTGIIT